MFQNNSTVAIFHSQYKVEEAIHDLEENRIDMQRLSIVGKDYHTEAHVLGYYDTTDRMKYWGTIGAAWREFRHLLFGSAFFWMPGIGPLLVGGPLVKWIIGGLEDAVYVGGLGPLGAALVGAGIPMDSVLQYETEVKNGKLLLVIQGTAAEVQQAKHLLDETGAGETIMHAGPVEELV